MAVLSYKWFFDSALQKNCVRPLTQCDTQILMYDNMRVRCKTCKLAYIDNDKVRTCDIIENGNSMMGLL